MISRADLGLQQNIYRGPQIRKYEIIILIFSFFVLSLIPFYIGLYKTLYGYAQFGPAAAGSWGVYWLYLSFIFFILILGFALYRLFLSKLCVSIHSSGIIITRALRKDRIVLWEQIAELYVNQKRANSKGPTVHTDCLILTTDKRKFWLRTSVLKNSLELITRIKSAVYIHLYPSIIENYRKGKVLIFGPIEIQLRYIKLNRFSYISKTSQIAWKDIDFVTIKSGYLQVVLQNHKIYQVRIAKIPNTELLLRLIQDRARD
jgi:hypothetical protein